MTYRTTFALDSRTVSRLKHLAGTWHTSQAEVVRRAIALADQTACEQTDKASLLRNLHQTGKLIAREKAETYLDDIRENRNTWRGEA